MTTAERSNCSVSHRDQEKEDRESGLTSSVPHSARRRDVMPPRAVSMQGSNHAGGHVGVHDGALGNPQAAIVPSASLSICSVSLPR